MSPLSSISVSKLFGAKAQLGPSNDATGNNDDQGDDELSMLVNEGGSGRMALTLRWLISELMVSSTRENHNTMLVPCT